MKKNNIDTQNYYTLISGATGGLGQAFCREVLKDTSNVFLTATNDTRLKKLREDLLMEYPNANIRYKSCDLSSFEDIENLIKYIETCPIQINRLINNAGYITEGSIKNADVTTLLKCIRVNAEGTIHLTKSLLDRKDNSPFKLITISSMASNYPMPYMAIYSSTKSLLSNFMTALREEYKKENVTVTIVEPGAIATSIEMQEAIKSQGLKGRLSCVSPERIAKKSIKLSNKNKRKYTPGIFNKITIFASAISPTPLKVRAISRMWKKSQEKRDIK